MDGSLFGGSPRLMGHTIFTYENANAGRNAVSSWDGGDKGMNAVGN